MRRLGVSEKTLASHGAVSRETALEMAQGMRQSAGADLALATTGIAGPSGGTGEKPVGLVYVALSCETGEYVHEMHFAGDRERIRGCLLYTSGHAGAGGKKRGSRWNGGRRNRILQISRWMI